MKNAFLGFVFVFFGSATQAQELGIRFGDVAGGNVAVDALFAAGKFSRIHADIAFGNGGVGIEGVWNFLYKPLGGEAFYWYVGVGASMRIDKNDFLLGPNGEIGLEYKFQTVPISLSVDWRPTLWIVERTDFNAGGFGLNVRYVFGGGNSKRK
jgi:hypothetical protein